MSHFCSDHHKNNALKRIQFLIPFLCKGEERFQCTHRYDCDWYFVYFLLMIKSSVRQFVISIHQFNRSLFTQHTKCLNHNWLSSCFCTSFSIRSMSFGDEINQNIEWETTTILFNTIWSKSMCLYIIIFLYNIHQNDECKYALIVVQMNMKMVLQKTTMKRKT